MSTKSPFRVTIGSGPSEVRPWEDARRAVHQLKTLAISGLVHMFDSERKLFCWRVYRTDRGMVREGVSHRYTLIALLGLHRLEASGTVSPIAIRPILDGLLADMDWVDNLGDLGLLLWLCALEDPQRLTESERRLEIENALHRFREGRHNSTMELAWFLAGVSHMSLTCPERQFDFRDAALETYRRLRNNQGDSGIFGHSGTAGSIAGRFRGRIGSFADQVYPIYAISKFAQAYHVPKATESALDCALTLCQAQGPQGQWWWHYDSVNGQVLESYPVYSVHQDGMAPLALFALGDATHSDFGPWIYKGLQWISGNNELDYEMPSPSARVIWRSMFRSSSKRYWNTAIAFVTKREDQATRNGLEVLLECRPYHLGWLLYAFAGRDAQLT